MTCVSIGASICPPLGSYCPSGTSSCALCPGGSYCPNPSTKMICNSSFYCPPGCTGLGTCPSYLTGCDGVCGSGKSVGCDGVCGSGKKKGQAHGDPHYVLLNGSTMTCWNMGRTLLASGCTNVSCFVVEVTLAQWSSLLS